MKKFFSQAFCFLFFSCLLLADWRTWRGPGNDGLSDSTKLPDSWSETENLDWKIPLPAAGSSTPIVVKNKIFLTFEQDEEVKAMGIGVDGRKLWTRVVCLTKGKGNGERTFASPTPSSDGKLVFVTSGTGEVVAFDLEGHEKWRSMLRSAMASFATVLAFIPRPFYTRRLYLQLIHSAAQSVICVEADSGKEVWKVERESDGVAECEHSYASPIAFRKGELNFLITHGNDYCIGHDPLTGKEQWRVADSTRRINTIGLFVLLPPSCKSGLVGCPFGQEPGVSVVRLSEAQGRIEKGGAGELWRMDRGTTGVTTPLLYKGLLYLCKENGTILCLDALTGEQFYQGAFTPKLTEVLPWPPTAGFSNCPGRYLYRAQGR